MHSLVEKKAMDLKEIGEEYMGIWLGEKKGREKCYSYIIISKKLLKRI